MIFHKKNNIIKKGKKKLKKILLGCWCLFICILIIIALKLKAVKYIPLFINSYSNMIITEPKINSNLIKVTFVSVLNGNTIIVNYEGKEKPCRLIGINCPESLKTNESENNDYGVMACNYTKQLLKNKKDLWLQFDKESTDPYENILAYVWLDNKNIDINNEDDINNYMLNAILLNDGYAINNDFTSNLLYDTYFKSFCNAAELKKLGLWNYEDYNQK